MCQFSGNESLIYKVKTQNKNNVNTVRKRDLILSKLARDVLHLYNFTVLYFNTLAWRWLSKLKHARVDVNKICLLIKFMFDGVHVLFFNTLSQLRVVNL